MESGDERFESYLREFEPRRPRALPTVTVARFDWRRFAAAAVVFITLGGTTWLATHEKRMRGVEGMTRTGVNGQLTTSRITAFSLTRTALENPKQLDAELTEDSRRVLPNFQGKESTLRVLAKE
jgi:hypothetical protein